MQIIANYFQINISKPSVSIVYISELHISKFDISIAATCGIYSLQTLLQTMEEQRTLNFQELVVEKGIVAKPDKGLRSKVL